MKRQKTEWEKKIFANHILQLNIKAKQFDLKKWAENLNRHSSQKRYADGQ